MSGSNRGNIFAVGLAGLFAVIVGMLLFANAAMLQSEYQHTAESRAQNYADQTARELERCVERVESERPECRDEAIERAREGQRREYDLEAQRVTAVWTQHMGIAAMIGMAISIDGVGLVWTTFNETRKANAMAKAQQRARLDIKIEFRPQSNPDYIDAVIFAENHGFSTALNALPTVATSETCPKFSDFTGIQGFARNIPGSEKSQMTVVFIEAKKAVGHIICVMIEYRCIFGESHKSYVCERVVPARFGSSDFVTMDVKPADWPADT
jgi:hypothetical protein